MCSTNVRRGGSFLFGGYMQVRINRWRAAYVNILFGICWVLGGRGVNCEVLERERNCDEGLDGRDCEEEEY